MSRLALSWMLLGVIVLQSNALQPNSLIDKALCSPSDLLFPTAFLETSSIEASPFLTSDCDMITDGPICLSKGDRMFLPYAANKGLIGYWSFDEEKPLDQSGRRNHLIGRVDAGPAFGGYGASAYFHSGNYLYVFNNNSFESSSFSLSFLVFIKTEATEREELKVCPLIQKGNDDLSAKKYQRNPAVYYNRKDKKLLVYIKTDQGDPQGELITSKSKLLPSKWYHIAVVKKQRNVFLYVNGLLDSKVELIGDSQTNQSPLYIGNVPWLKKDCTYPFLLDELRYYSIALDKDYIQAEASPILGGIEPSYIEIGCLKCSLSRAVNSCNEGYRLCTSIELYTGGYQISRSLGLINSNTTIWTHNLLTDLEKYSSMKGLGLCCAILK